MTLRNSANKAVSLVLIAGTLMAPASLAATGDDEDAQFNAKWALSSARVLYMSNGSYEGVTAERFTAKHPGLVFVDDAPSTGPNVVSVKVVDPQHLRLAVYGAATCWGVREEGRQGGIATLYAKRAGPADECTATSFKDDEFSEHEMVWN